MNYLIWIGGLVAAYLAMLLTMGAIGRGWFIVPRDKPNQQQPPRR